MSRKKTARRSAKRQSPNQNSALLQLEKEFMRTPAKLSAQLNKVIMVLKQKENKLKNVLNKHITQTQNSESRVNSAASKTTAAGKKQLKKAKKAHTVFMRNQAAANKELEAATKSLQKAVNKHAKMSALKKHINQFEKDWAKNAMKVSKDKVKSKPHKKSKMHEPARQEMSQAQNFETAMGDDIVSERTEITS